MKANKIEESGREFEGKLIFKEDVSADSNRFVRSRVLYIEGRRSFWKRMKTTFIITSASLSALLSLWFYYY